MTKLYTAVGRLTFKRQIKGMRCPQVVLGDREYILDIQEMLLWSVLNWRILSMDEIETLYANKEKETGIVSHRNVEECLGRLVQRGLVNCGRSRNGCGRTFMICCPNSALCLFLKALFCVRFPLYA